MPHDGDNTSAAGAASTDVDAQARGGLEATVARAEAPHFLLDFTREIRADEASITLRDGDVVYHLKGRDQGTPGLVTLRWSPRLHELLEQLRKHSEVDVSELAARIGLLLADFVASPAWTRVIDGVAIAATRRAFLTVRSSAAELYLLPWELATVGNIPHVGALERLLMRYEMPGTTTATPTPGLSATTRGRVVFAWSTEGGKVQADRHREIILRAAEESRGCFDQLGASALFEVDHASCARVIEALEQARAEGEPVAVLHLLCHGAERDGSFGLVFDNSDDINSEDHVSAVRLANLLRSYAGMVRLVVLSSCDGSNGGAIGNVLGSVAQELHKAGFRAVIAARLPLSWEGARDLAAILYAGILGQLRPLEEVLLEVKAGLLKKPTHDWAGLQLYARESDGDATYAFNARPYRGLSTYGPEHTRFFFGREREIEEVLGDLAALRRAGAPRLVVVSGASGTGKSSLVLGGVIPRLRRDFGERFERVVVRPSDGFDEVLEAVDKTLDGSTKRELILAVVDQFEEVFSHGDRDAADRFVRALWRRASTPGSPLCLVLTLRLEFLPRCSELVLDDSGRRLDTVTCDQAHQVLVPLMSPERLRRAIEGPASAAGLALEDGLADLIVREVEAGPGALPLMSHALHLLWCNRESQTLTRAVYERIGRVAGALDRHAETVWTGADEASRAMMRRLLLALVTPGDVGVPDTRRRRRLDDLRKGFEKEAASFEATLKRLVDARLLVTGDEEAQRVEIAHEALLHGWRRLGGWIETDHGRLVQLAQLDRWAAEWRETPDALLRGSRLALAEEADRTYGGDLSVDARALLVASRAERARERAVEERRRLRWRVAIAAVCVLTAIAGGVGWWLKVKADRAAKEARGSARRARAEEVLARAGELRARGEVLDHQLENLGDALVFREEVRSVDGVVPLEVDGALLAAAVSLAIRPKLEDEPVDLSWVRFSPDGTRLAGTSTAGGVYLWDAADGRLLTKRAGTREHESLNVKFTGDGRSLNVAFEGGAVSWRATDGALVGGFRDGNDAGASGEILARAPQLSSDGALVQQDGLLRRVVDGTRVASLSGEPPYALDIRLSPDGEHVWALTADATLRVWDAQNASAGPVVRPPSEARGPWRRARLSPDGDTVVFCAQDGPFRVWQISSGRVRDLDLTTDVSDTRRLVCDNEFPGRFPEFTVDGRLLHTPFASGSVPWLFAGDSPIFTWSSATGARLPIGGKGDLLDIADDGSRWLFDFRREVISIAQLGGDGMMGDVRRHVVWAGAFTAQGITLAVRERGMHLWSDGDGTLIRTVGGYRSPVTSVELASRGEMLVHSNLEIFLANSDGSVRQLPMDGNRCEIAAISSDGAAVAARCDSNAIRVWSARDGAILRTIGQWAPPVIRDPQGGEPQRDPLLCGVLRFASNATRLYVTVPHDDLHVARGDRSCEVRFFDVSSGLQGPTLRASNSRSISSAWGAPDGSRIVTGYEGGDATLWDVAHRTVIAETRAPTGELRAARFAVDGSRVISVFSDGALVEWNALTGQGPPPRRLGTTPVRRAWVSQNGDSVFTCHNDGGDRLWETATARLLAALPHQSGGATAAAFSPDHTRLATGYEDGTVALWSASNGRLLANLPAHIASVTSIAFSADSMRLATGSDDGTARIWALDPAVIRRVSCDLMRRRRTFWNSRADIQRVCRGQ